MSNSPSDLEKIEKRIRDLKEKNAPNLAKSDLAHEYSQAFQIAIDFIAPMIIGLSIGYMFDIYFETLPLCMIILIFLGFAAGILNIYKTYNLIKDKQE